MHLLWPFLFHVCFEGRKFLSLSHDAIGFFAKLLKLGIELWNPIIKHGLAAIIPKRSSNFPKPWLFQENAFRSLI
jgi:hypothetical protein